MGVIFFPFFIFEMFLISTLHHISGLWVFLQKKQTHAGTQTDTQTCTEANT